MGVEPMQVGAIIKSKRQEQGLTQEQVAACLGVSAPAVNKWEKGVCYPDITLLAPLARLLRIDLNTLLSFNQELTDREIGEFINWAAQAIPTDGYDKVFECCMDRIREYPTCDKLMLNLALVLMGTLHMYTVLPDKQQYEDKLNRLYEHCANSADTSISQQAISLLVSRYIQQQDYAQAQSYLDMLPEVRYDKSQLQGSLSAVLCRAAG